MDYCNSQSDLPSKVLATDLDGTLIPLGKDHEQISALEKIKKLHSKKLFPIIFATGRQFSSVQEGINEYKLPKPEWIICDVGTSIYKQKGKDYILVKEYQSHLNEQTVSTNRDILFNKLINELRLTPQEENHQQEFKLSFYCKSEETEATTSDINSKLKEWKYNYTCMGSIDPFLNCGMLDILPSGVNKAYAVIWLAEFSEINPDEIIYSGDSGNDFAALTHGFRSIVVNNASEGLAEKVETVLKKANLEDHFYHAKSNATAGVLEGLIHFGLVK